MGQGQMRASHLSCPLCRGDLEAEAV
jgi:hypothetical protein